jgi:putative PIN family toxin of toxin-antitoxin system
MKELIKINLAYNLDFLKHGNMICDMKIIRVVLDTNVLVAASRSRSGASFALLLALRNGQFSALASIPLMLEYEAVLKRPEQLAASGRNAAMTDAFLDALSLFIEPVHLHYLWRPQLRDPADEMVLETALNGRAEALVTLNIADFVPAGHFQLPVLTPGTFLHRLREEKT